MGTILTNQLGVSMPRFSLLMFCSLLIGCSTKKVSTITSVQPKQPNASIEQENQCGWVQVNEVQTKSILNIPISLTPRQFDRQLYYCCPGPKDKPEPVCYQSKWVVKQ